MTAGIITNKGFTVKGSGVICAIGSNKIECLESLKSMRSGVGMCELLQTNYKSIFPVGEVKLTNNELCAWLQIPDRKKDRYTRTTLLAIIAVKEALEEAQVDLHDGKRTGLVVGTSVGGMTNTEMNYRPEVEDEDPSYMLTHPCGDVSEKMAKYLGINDYYTAINTACSSSANAIMHGVRLLNTGYLDRVIVGGTDALSIYTINGFNSLMILSNELSKPFDADRKGLNLGEGAGFLVLERPTISKQFDSYLEPEYRVMGCANFNDAYHQTASSPEGNGAFNAMCGALKMSGLLPKDVDYVNTHGTGTSNNDFTEGVAMKRVFCIEHEADMPSFSSTKTFTGHTLGASSGIEAVISLLTMQNSLIFPNLNFHKPIEKLNIVPVTEVMYKEVDVVLSNSFGFAGNCSSVVFAKVAR